MHTEELFKLFFRLLDPDMHPPRLYQRGDLEMLAIRNNVWKLRFYQSKINQIYWNAQLRKPSLEGF